MITRDDRLLSEAYDDVGQVDEGMFDRMKGRSAGKQAYKDAGGKTGLAGVGQKLKRGAITALGGNVKAGETKQIKAAQNASNAANVAEVAAQHVQKIQADLNKMQIDLSNIQDDSLRKAIQGIMNYVPTTPTPASGGDYKGYSGKTGL